MATKYKVPFCYELSMCTCTDSTNSAGCKSKLHRCICSQYSDGCRSEGHRCICFENANQCLADLHECVCSSSCGYQLIKCKAPDTEHNCTCEYIFKKIHPIGSCRGEKHVCWCFWYPNLRNICYANEHKCSCFVLSIKGNNLSNCFLIDNHDGICKKLELFNDSKRKQCRCEECKRKRSN